MFHSVKNKKFIDLSSNNEVYVKDQFENIAILNDNRKIDVRRLLDKNFYDEYIDPTNFFNDNDNLNLFADKIKSIPTEFLEKMEDDSVPVMAYDPEEEKKMLIEKANKIFNSNDNVNSSIDQINKFKHLIDEDENFIIPEEIYNNNNIVDEKVEHIRVEDVQNQVTQVQKQPNIIMSDNKQIDPIFNLFKNTKRNYDFSISIKIENKIPRIDFIEMMEDSYETSIIDYLADEFTNKILSDPSYIKDIIKSGIKDIVYKKEIKKEKIKSTPTKTLKESEITTKPKIRIMSETMIPKSPKKITKDND